MWRGVHSRGKQVEKTRERNLRNTSKSICIHRRNNHRQWDERHSAKLVATALIRGFFKFEMKSERIFFLAFAGVCLEYRLAHRLCSWIEDWNEEFWQLIVSIMVIIFGPYTLRGRKLEKFCSVFTRYVRARWLIEHAGRKTSHHYLEHACGAITAGIQLVATHPLDIQFRRNSMGKAVENVAQHEMKENQHEPRVD